ncbi:MAG: hypothetical protein QM757_41255 [Paludibaculum sp.]
MEGEVGAEAAVDAYFQVNNPAWLEALLGDGDGVMAGRQQGGGVVALLVGDDGAGGAGVLVLNLDIGCRDGAPRWCR